MDADPRVIILLDAIDVLRAGISFDGDAPWRDNPTPFGGDAVAEVRYRSVLMGLEATLRDMRETGKPFRL